jgi:hypothetical protein
VALSSAAHGGSQKPAPRPPSIPESGGGPGFCFRVAFAEKRRPTFRRDARADNILSRTFFGKIRMAGETAG